MVKANVLALLAAFAFALGNVRLFTPDSVASRLCSCKRVGGFFGTVTAPKDRTALEGGDQQGPSHALMRISVIAAIFALWAINHNRDRAASAVKGLRYFWTRNGS
jgi:hypothetical protein